MKCFNSCIPWEANKQSWHTTSDANLGYHFPIVGKSGIYHGWGGGVLRRVIYHWDYCPLASLNIAIFLTKFVEAPGWLLAMQGLAINCESCYSYFFLLSGPSQSPLSRSSDSGLVWPRVGCSLPFPPELGSTGWGPGHSTCWDARSPPDLGGMGGEAQPWNVLSCFSILFSLYLSFQNSLRTLFPSVQRRIQLGSKA